MYVFNPTPGCDTKSIFKLSKTGLNSEFSLFKSGHLTDTKKTKQNKKKQYALLFIYRRIRVEEMDSWLSFMQMEM